MRLLERADFGQLITATAERTGLPEAFIEKDYYLTEILRVTVGAYPGAVVFKGGTSLSKGFRLLARFSEDIDLLVRPGAMAPAWSANSSYAPGLKRVCATACAVPGLTVDPARTKVSRPKRRAQFATYAPLVADLPGIEAGILVETGIGAGDWPTVERPIRSLISEFVADAGLTAEVATDDLDAFPVEILSLGRTFVEKLFLVHAAVERLRTGAEPIGRTSRHFADLAVLAERPEVAAMLDDGSYRNILLDVDRASREWYGTRHLPPADLDFARSSAFLTPDVFDLVEPDYRRECDRLFFGRAHPDLAAGQALLAALRPRL